MVNLEIKVIFEDQEILVLDKPSGITVNKSDTTKEEKTVQDWIENKFSIFNFQFSKGDEETDFYKRAGIVHRLDKETSGILLVAKTLRAFEDLQKQFKERMVKKTYLALVRGKMEPSEDAIVVPVGRLPWNRKHFGVLAGGREAETRYKTIFNFSRGAGSSFAGQFSIFNEPLTLLELYPQTGRTHQIRVHLKYVGYPIFGDPLYAGRKISKRDRKVLSRTFLHASKITFLHPVSNESISLESPLPQELQGFLDQLKVA